ncbi:hypothetical protein MPSEU_000592500 [Mayamaea pseudoterrestris]|nr:hypothetical protein MPSEU_000592500 [Mayamaea pseudoterrestris]
MPSAPPVPVLFPATKLKRFRTLNDNAYPLTTYLANEEAQMIISEGFESDERDALVTFQACQDALAKFPFSVDAFLEVAYLYETYWNDLDKARTSYERAIKCCECLWPELEQVQIESKVELHEMRLLQQAYFGLANLELDHGNFEQACSHVAMLERLDPDDVSGNRAMFHDKYESIMNPTVVADEDYSDQNSDAGSDAKSIESDANSFYDDSGGEGYSDDESSTGNENSVGDDIDEGSSSSNNFDRRGTASIPSTIPLIIQPEITSTTLPLPQPARESSHSRTRASGEILPSLASKPGSPLPSASISKTSLRRINRYISKPMVGTVDKTLATSYFLSANVSLENGDIDAALEHARSILKVDPKDECGCLWKFFEKFVRANFEEEDMEQILSGGPSSCECYFRYCFIILDIMKLESGDATVEKVNETIVRALRTNPLVPILLLSNEELPDITTQQVAGGLSEAIWYVKTDLDTWSGVDEALQYMHDARFQNGPKPLDDGSILKRLLAKGRVLVDVAFPDTGFVETWECTSQGTQEKLPMSVDVDPSNISCYAVPVELDREGRRLEGKCIIFPWSSVNKVHFWHLLFAALDQEREITAGGCDSPVNDSVDMQNTTTNGVLSPKATGENSLPILEDKARTMSRPEDFYTFAIKALDENDTALATEHVRSLLEVDLEDELEYLSKIFEAFIRQKCSDDDVHNTSLVCRENAELFFRWRFVLLDQEKVNRRDISVKEFNETIVRALELNSFVPTFLLQGATNNILRGPFPPGSTREAQWYVNTEIEIWDRKPEALEAILFARFRSGLKPDDDGALLMSLFERCKVVINVLIDGKLADYECCIAAPDGHQIPKDLFVKEKSAEFICYAIPAHHSDEQASAGRWLSFKYDSVEKVPFWKILIDSKFLLERNKTFTKPTIVRETSVSDLSAGSLTPKESLLRRTLMRSSLSNKTLLAAKPAVISENESSALKLNINPAPSPGRAHQQAQHPSKGSRVALLRDKLFAAGGKKPCLN